jgi:hypothetical protein
MVSLAKPPKPDQSGMLPILHRERDYFNLKASASAFQNKRLLNFLTKWLLKLRKNITKKAP